MPDSRPTDQQLLERVSQGCMESWGELFQRYHAAVVSLAFRMLGDASAADAVAQDVFLRVRRHAGKYDPKRAVRPWLFTIAANLCRDHQTRYARRETGELLAEPAGAAADPLQQLAASEDCAAVRRAIAELPDIYREIVVLRMYERLPYADIGRMLGVREGTARSRMEYALDRLRKALRNLNEPPAPERSARRGAH